MSEWKDTTSYQRGETPRMPREWELRAAGVRVRVHRLHGIPDQWFLSSDLHGDSPLESKDADGAKREAARIVGEAAEAIAHAMSKHW